jgi:hypothetical protein
MKGLPKLLPALVAASMTALLSGCGIYCDIVKAQADACDARTAQLNIRIAEQNSKLQKLQAEYDAERKSLDAKYANINENNSNIFNAKQCEKKVAELDAEIARLKDSAETAPEIASSKKDAEPLYGFARSLVPPKKTPAKDAPSSSSFSEDLRKALKRIAKDRVAKDRVVALGKAYLAASGEAKGKLALRIRYEALYQTLFKVAALCAESSSPKLFPDSMLEVRLKSAKAFDTSFYVILSGAEQPSKLEEIICAEASNRSSESALWEKRVAVAKKFVDSLPENMRDPSAWKGAAAPRPGAEAKKQDGKTRAILEIVQADGSSRKYSIGEGSPSLAVGDLNASLTKQVDGSFLVLVSKGPMRSSSSIGENGRAKITVSESSISVESADGGENAEQDGSASLENAPDAESFFSKAPPQVCLGWGLQILGSRLLGLLDGKDIDGAPLDDACLKALPAKIVELAELDESPGERGFRIRKGLLEAAARCLYESGPSWRPEDFLSTWIALSRDYELMSYRFRLGYVDAIEDRARP